jgi:hypothetical protein
MSLDSQVLERRISKDLPYVEANLNYLIPMAEKPVNYTYEPPPGIPRYNGTYQAYKLPIYNARSISNNISLDREGFAFLPHHSSVRDFYDEDEIRNVYYPEAEQLLKEVTGATKVVIFDHTLRNWQRFKQGENGIREPARRELAAREIDDIDTLLQQRFAIINVWRAIAAPVQESPLAVCDAQSIAPTDLVASDLVYRDRVGEVYGITYNPEHQWFYFPQMQRDEALFIKCFDSAEDGRARFAAHTGFDDPTSPPDAPPRESIELRTFVFYPA